MRIINSRDIMETIEMLTAENLDVRTQEKIFEYY